MVALLFGIVALGMGMFCCKLSQLTRMFLVDIFDQKIVDIFNEKDAPNPS